MGNKNPFGVIIATICGVPMYADIFGCIPISEVRLGKDALLGVVLSFMMAVTTLSFPSLVMLSKAVKTKLLGIFIERFFLKLIFRNSLKRKKVLCPNRFADL